ncbi:hypothetical protein CUJ83_13440 [Methanocella sp. CWC-04]|uniref:Uncharacterized protein n=1 Tax=Methanooceanicella nereidis TaxID=2052831 RepID=A0AAP2RFT2_9EURY|nr:hypothetical protein [Methanocella sp. CWC-04]MCD1296001.1 hypothetical protein [Methanocella sp. CWC-04]
MSDSMASRAVKNTSKSIKELLFSPFDIIFLLRAYFVTSLRLKSDDGRILEMQRLKPFYRGTRLLTGMGLILIAAAFLLPFSVIFVGMDGFWKLLIAYMAVFFIFSIAGIVLEAALDAVFALMYVHKFSFTTAVSKFINYTRSNPGDSVKYMGVKLLLDISFMTVILGLFMPMMIEAIIVMLKITAEVQAGTADVGSIAFSGLAIVTILGALAFLSSMILSVPISAFYGYYTENAVKDMMPIIIRKC